MLRIATACLFGLSALPCMAQTSASDAARLADLSLEQLREVVVTTVSRVAQRLDRVAASAYVISAEDIRRSGATTIPEALRLAPTLNVARADASQYVIGARGFNNLIANKMLVLIDGRTVYTPLFSGVFWEAQDVMLEDVERIEVITGPSTALWGSNAVNGLIHVITRSAVGTQGGAALLHGGEQERGAAARYGLRLGESGRMRVYAKSYDREATARANGSSVGDAANGVQAGFRADWAFDADRLTLQGDAYRGTIDQATSARRFSGSNITARWQRAFAGGGEASVQVYVDHTEREHPLTFSEKLDTFDAVAQYSFRPTQDQRLVLGGGWRHSRDRTGHGAALAFIPESRTLEWGRVFAQDQIDLTRTLALTLAASVEKNPYTGAEVLPSLRLAWTPQDNRLLWGSLSRAVRAPSRIDREFFQPATPPFIVAGGPRFEPEVSTVLEIGYRAQPGPSVSYALTAFHAEHRKQRSLAPTAEGLQFENGIEGSTTGLESWARWRVTERWRLHAGLVLQNQKLRVSDGAVDAAGVAALGNDPRRQATLRSLLDLGPAWSWDVDLRHVGALPNPSVPAYTAVGSRVAWKVTPRAELTFGVHNLFDNGHAEWGVASNRVEFERSFFVQLRLGL